MGKIRADTSITNPHPRDYFGARARARHPPWAALCARYLPACPHTRQKILHYGEDAVGLWGGDGILLGQTSAGGVRAGRPAWSEQEASD